MRDDVGAGLVAHPAGATEVIGVAVCDDHRVHPADRDAGGGEAGAQLLERRPAGQTGVDERDAALVGDDVAVDVAEAGHVDRQLAAQHTGRHLGDLRDSVLLLLATGAVGHRSSVRLHRLPRRPVTRSPGGVGVVRGRLVRRVAAAVVDPSAPPAGSRSSGSRRRRAGARRGARRCPTCSLPCSPQLRPGDELVVVDDHSSDGTADVAAAHGATVVAAPALPSGWVGKPHACWIGAGATTAPLLVFLDADVRPGPDLLDGLAAVDRRPTPSSRCSHGTTRRARPRWPAS